LISPSFVQIVIEFYYTIEQQQNIFRCFFILFDIFVNFVNFSIVQNSKKSII